MLDLESGCGKRQRATDLTLTLLVLTGARTAALAVRAGSVRCYAFGAVALERLHVEVVR
jgi:hypothetical protein